MPLLPKKQAVLPAPEPNLSSLNDSSEVFYLEKTGEVFTDYQSVPALSPHFSQTEQAQPTPTLPPVYSANPSAGYRSYIDRLAYLYTRQFSCEFSGKHSLDYFAALESEKQEARVVSQRFPDQLKGRVLQTTQFRQSSLLVFLASLNVWGTG